MDEPQQRGLGAVQYRVGSGDRGGDCPSLPLQGQTGCFSISGGDISGRRL